ncbi:MAG: hypothetical protein ACHQU0_03645 [Candidatus Paceibacteria bacterium]
MDRLKGLRNDTREIIEAAIRHLGEERPATLRHLYYLISQVDGLAPATEAGNGKIRRAINAGRERGVVSWEDIIDGSREALWPSSRWKSPEDFLSDVRSWYRRDRWQSQPERVELWYEKDTLDSLLEEVGEEFGVTLRSLHGYTSHSQLYAAAKELSKLKKPVTIFYLGDHDPDGYGIEDSAREELYEHFTGRFGRDRATLRFERIGFLPGDFREFGIRPLEAKMEGLNGAGPRFAARFKNDLRSAEIDALPAKELRHRASEAIRSRIDWKAWKKEERAERRDLKQLKETM